MTINPYTYLLVPFSIADNSLSFFKDYLNSCNQKECSKWKYAKVTNISKQPVFREAAYNAYLKPFFNAFIGEETLSDCVVLSLKEKAPYCDEPLSFENNANNFFFSIQDYKSLFDTINYQSSNKSWFISYTNQSRSSSRWISRFFVYSTLHEHPYKDEEQWTLNEKIEELMEDFREHYRKFNEYYAQHLTYIFYTKMQLMMNTKQC